MKLRHTVCVGLGGWSLTYIDGEERGMAGGGRGSMYI